nr:MAG TPA: hypothetical protein [Caudoviricetes sp.]
MLISYRGFACLCRNCQKDGKNIFVSILRPVFGATCPEEIRTLNSIACLAKKIKIFLKILKKYLTLYVCSCII